MAQLVLDLSQFKSSGVYTVEVDQSERIVVTTQSLRLLPGFSSVGPFNTPVFIRSTRDRLKFYGDVDKKLERKGSFFHRSIDTALLQAPVFAINLLKVNEVDNATNTDTVNFAALSIDACIKNTGILSTSVDSSVSGLSSSGYAAKVSQDIYVNFFNRERFWKPDPDYLEGVVQNTYGGISEISAPLISIVNIGTKTLSFVVRKAVGLQGYDVYAKDWYGAEDNIPYEWIRPYDKLKDYFVNVIAFEGDWTNYASLALDPVFGAYFTTKGLKPDQLNNFLNLPQITLTGSWFGCIIPDFRDQTGADQYIENVVNASVVFTGVMVNVNQKALDNLYYDASFGIWTNTEGSNTSANFVVDLVGHGLAKKTSTALNASVNVISSFLSYDISIRQTDFYSRIDASLLGTTGKIFITNGDASSLSIGSLMTKLGGGNVAPGVTPVVSKVSIAVDSSGTSATKWQIETAEPIYITTDGSAYAQKEVDNLLVTDHYRVIKMKGLTITNNHLPGYSTTGAANNEEGVSKIYGMLTEDSGILRGLTNPDMIQYRYVVDTMAYGLGSNCGGKVYLARLAKARGKTTAIISAPAISQFASSQNPWFCDTFVQGVDPKPIFNSEWIPQGGNPNLPRTFRFTLPDEDNGGKYCGVFGPFLLYTENGLTFPVPPAADVANSYVKKFLGGNPYAIVANQQGIISNPNVSSIEYAIDKYDRDFLEPFGYNSIIQRPQTGQILLYANVTSYQNVKSDYNYLHVRELLNTIELQVESVLNNYVFALNNAVTRLNIVNSVTPILESIKDAGALYKYEVIMDENNNTASIVDEGFAIIDIGVWITKGMQKIINRITVNKLGTVSNGGFTAV